MTELNDVTFAYGRHTILRDLTFRVEKGECLVLAGPNGSGKSTVLSLIAGALRPGSGRISTGGRVGYVPQGTALFEDMTVEDNLRFFAAAARCSIPLELPFGLNSRLRTKAGKLSGGLKKQVSIACALLGDPQVILLDEPCAALDMEYRDELIALLLRLKEEGRTLLYAGHEPMEFYSFCDKLLFMGNEPHLYTREELCGSCSDPVHFAHRFSQLFHQPYDRK